MKAAKRIAFCGVVSALAVLPLLMTFFSYATYALAALGGILLIPVAVELGSRYAFACFAVTALLGGLLAPDPEARVMFLLFFGYYPILHLRIALWQKPVLAWVVRLLIFNAAMIASYFAAVLLLGIPADSYSIGGVELPGVLLLLGNVAFAAYEILLSRLAAIYRVRWHPRVKRLFS
ncbi:MAG: hypothetical protein IJU16_02415 [Clostridia bacterium]|nr:hypothetical protein [Clostridia bacterium]